MKVKSAITEIGYMDESLAIPEIDMDMKEAGSTAKKFENSEHDMMEGCAGLMPIDTTYENFTEEHISLVSSDKTDKPAAHDVAKGNYPQRWY